MAFADDQLDSESAHHVSQSLRDYPEDQQTVEAFRQLGSFIRALEDEQECGPDLTNQIMQQVESCSTPPSKILFLRNKRLANWTGVSFIFAAAASMLLWRYSQSFAHLAPLATLSFSASHPLVRPAASFISNASLVEPSEISTEVETVDFGENLGKIFYLPGDAITTVIWVREKGETP